LPTSSARVTRSKIPSAVEPAAGAPSDPRDASERETDPGDLEVDLGEFCDRGTLVIEAATTAPDVTRAGDISDAVEEVATASGEADTASTDTTATRAQSCARSSLRE
jgi:hypothetical protein